MTKPPHDEPTAAGPEELREQVEQSREEPGRTVEALAAKADVKARAQEKATVVKEQVTARAGDLKEQAAVTAGELKDKAAQAARHLEDKLPVPVKDRTARAIDQSRAVATQLWQDKAPEPMQQKTAQGARMARDNRSLLLAAAGVALMAWLAGRRRKG
ncbi:DUF3618 domain-containing protein [Streptomyces sp. HUAS TT11]|uniref:DUF3618 domain-containing protein n=1 Tax=Streptomyces sp. HUAS TT11 TaxID=3447508 RepID=UPI003F65884D